MPDIRRDRRAVSHRANEPLPALVPTPSEILRRAFPPGSGSTPWAARPGRPWVCQECGEHLRGSDLALARVIRRPWGTRIVWEASEWRHSIYVGVPGDGTIASVEAAIRQALESRSAAARWDSRSQKLRRAIGRRPEARPEERGRR